MKPIYICLSKCASVFALVCLPCLPVPAAEPPRFTDVKPVGAEISLSFTAPAEAASRLEISEDLARWQALATFAPTAAAQQFTDSNRPQPAARYYRLLQLPNPAPVSGDHIPTSAGDAVVHPIVHASFLLQWNGVNIYNDPDDRSTSYRTRYDGLPKGDLILVSHTHGDHFDAAMIATLRATNGWIVAPQAVYSSLSTALRASTIVLTNGASTNLLGMTIEAVPAYNSNHARGSGNGYVVTLGGKRFYMAGDTGNTAEMRALADIDVAFLCINTPFTMTVNDATNAVTAFRPRSVYPYHYQNQDGTQGNAAQFKQRLDPTLPIEVRLRGWY